MRLKKLLFIIFVSLLVSGNAYAEIVGFKLDRGFDGKENFIINNLVKK